MPREYIRFTLLRLLVKFYDNHIATAHISPVAYDYPCKPYTPMIGEFTASQEWLRTQLRIIVFLSVTVVAVAARGLQHEKDAGHGKHHTVEQQEFIGKGQGDTDKRGQACLPSFDRRYLYAGNPTAAPGYPHEIHIRTNIGYLVGYVEEKKTAAWVGYRLFRSNETPAPPRPHRFRVDIRCRTPVTHLDYSGSGYDRGHQAPNYAIAVCYGRDAQIETFLMSNVIPQTPGLNRGVWKRLEQRAIKDWAYRFEEIWVIAGGIFKDDERLASGVAVPAAFYKIVIDEQNGQPRVLAFIIKQDVKRGAALDGFLTTVHDIEEQTGLAFLVELPEELKKRLTNTRGQLW